MRDIALTVVFFSLVPYIFKYPEWGAYLWAWMSYMNPHMQCWGFARTMPFAEITAIVTLLTLLFNKNAPKKIPWTAESVLMLIWLGWMLFTTFFAFYPTLAWEQFDKVWKVLLMTFVTIMLLNKREYIDIFVWVIVLSIGYYGFKGGIFTIVHGGIYNVMGPSQSFWGGRAETGVALMMSLPLMRYLQMQTERRWLNLALGVLMVLTALAMIGTNSRGALIGGAAMGIVFLLKSRNKLYAALLIAVAVGAIMSIMPQAWFDRMQTIQTYEQDASAMGRVNAWHMAFNMALDRPMTGGGFESFRYPQFVKYAPNPDDVHDAHSIYFEVLGEQGFPGLAIYLSIMLLAWWRAGRIIKATRRDPDKKWMADLAAMVQVTMLGYAAGGAFLGLAYFDFYYHLVALVVILQLQLKAGMAPASRIGFVPRKLPAGGLRPGSS